MNTYTASEKEKIVESFNACPSGSFAFIENYKASNGEVSNFYIQCGIKYENILKKSVDIIQELKDGKLDNINVSYDTYMDSNNL